MWHYTRSNFQEKSNHPPQLFIFDVITKHSHFGSDFAFSSALPCTTTFILEGVVDFGVVWTPKCAETRMAGWLPNLTLTCRTVAGLYVFTHADFSLTFYL